MTDIDPLAPIEALADNWARGYPSLVIAPQLRAALAEARQAMDALVAQRDGWEQRFRELQTESRVLPCDGGCVNAPEEDCSRHGRTPAELWRIINEIRAERDAAREALDHNVARIEDMLATLSMVADRLDEFTYDELRSVLDDDPLDQWGEIYKSRLTEAREALARVEALAGTTIEGEVDGKPTPVPLIWASDLRAAIAQPATDEEAGQ